MTRPKSSAELSDAIRNLAARCTTEMELQIGVEKLIDPILQQLPFRTRFGRATRLGGIPDALHGNMIIEYERPRKLTTKAGISEAIRQLKQYLLEESAQKGIPDHIALRRMVGVGLDGHRILFVRYRGSHPQDRTRPLTVGQIGLFEEDEYDFTVNGPHPVTADTIDLFVGYLQSLARHPLTAEALAETFGPRSEVAQRVVRLFYDKVVAAGSPRVCMFFDEWQRIFGIVYGQDIDKAEAEARALANQFGVSKAPRLKEFLFAVHTYFALLMKLLAAELMTMQRGSTLQSFIQPLIAMDSDNFRAALADLEDGGLFSRQEIVNFLEGDFFSWYLSVWDGKVAHELRFLTNILGGFDPRTPDLAPDHSRDLLKKLYQYLVPKKLRHDLGEYYTPDWLAEHLLDEIGYSGDVDSRVLDPACGSGTFLVLAIKKVKGWAEDPPNRPPVSPKVTARKILKNLCGFDLNPIAVIAARTNFLLALGELVRYVRPIEIPVYICDSVLTPAKHRRQRDLHELSGYELTTRAGTFTIPREIVDCEAMDHFARILEDCARNVDGYTSEDFVRLVKREIGIDLQSVPLLERLHEQIAELERTGRNRIWARFIKNAFAPVFKARDRFHFVVGNPPWVNWEHLAAEYREETASLWRDYGFFTQKGYRAVVPAGKLDMAALFTYAAMDAYVKQDGKLGFVITQSVFKSSGAGEGFRKFSLPEDIPLCVDRACDMVALNPFEGAQNRTAMIQLQKGRRTTYPISYDVWLPREGYLKVRRDSGFEPSLLDVKATTEIVRVAASPIDKSKPESPWLTVPANTMNICDKVVGQSHYRAREGVNTLGANGVYWFEVKGSIHDRRAMMLAQNMTEGAKKQVRQFPPTLIESDLLYPLLRGKDVSRWHAQPSLAILMTHQPEAPKTPIGYEAFKAEFPRAHSYLLSFRPMLQQRPRVKKLKLAWHTLGEVGPYTFANYKLVWREQASDFTAAVVGSCDWDGTKKLILPDHKLMLISCNLEEEAHFLCGVLNSSLVRLIVKGYVLETSTSVHVMEHVGVPRFDAGSPTHKRIAALSKAAHEAVEKAAIMSDLESPLSAIEAELDRVVAKIWHVSGSELQQVAQGLKIFDRISPESAKKEPSAVGIGTSQRRIL